MLHLGLIECLGQLGLAAEPHRGSIVQLTPLLLSTSQYLLASSSPRQDIRQLTPSVYVSCVHFGSLRDSVTQTNAFVALFCWHLHGYPRDYHLNTEHWQ